MVLRTAITTFSKIFEFIVYEQVSVLNSKFNPCPHGLTSLTHNVIYRGFKTKYI
jgi:hypothetical protein